MADYSLYDATIPQATSILGTFISLLDAAKAHAAENKTDIDEYLGHRLIDDMRDFRFQIYMACRTTKDLVAHCQGLEPTPNHMDYADIKTLDDLYGVVKDAQQVVEAVDRNKVVGRASATTNWVLGPGMDVTSTVAQFVGGFALPNMNFHVATAYGILRSKGVPLGKRVFLTPFFTTQKLPL